MHRRPQGVQNREPPEAKPPRQQVNSLRFRSPGEPANEPAAGESSSSSSSSNSAAETGPGDDESAADADHKPLTRTQRRHLPKVEDLDRREAEDVQVSRYYFSTGDFQAAYLRAKDAVKTIPDDPEAHFALAESAERLKKPEEAVLEYQACLTLDPDGTKAKLARKALSRLK